jgi:hypothetical protein
MKIRIKSKGLPKAQWLNSQIGIPNIFENIQKARQAYTQEGIQPADFSRQEQTVPVVNPSQPISLTNWMWSNPLQSEAPALRINRVKTDGSIETTGQKGNPEYTVYEQANSTNVGGTFKSTDITPGTNSTAPNKRKSPFNAFDYLSMASTALDYANQTKKAKQFDRNLRNQAFDITGSASPEFEGNYDINTGMFQPNRIFNPNEGMGMAEQGGQLNTTMKIRITKGPQENMAYGGQSNYGLDLGRKKVYTDMADSRSENIRKTLNPVPREMANIEAEKGETAYGDLLGNGDMIQMNIGGQRHSQGGTPLNVPEGTFIFSDTAKMRIKDPQILKYFSLPAKSKGYTPAEIAKRYDIVKYKAIIEDPNADELNKSTAQLMVKKYQEKLGQLALVQEGMKGFPGGIPKVAQDEMPQEMPQAAYGGALPEYQGIRGPSQVGASDPRYFYEMSILQGLRNAGLVPANYTPGQITGAPMAAAAAAPASASQTAARRTPSSTGKPGPTDDVVFLPQTLEEMTSIQQGKPGSRFVYSDRYLKGDTRVPYIQPRQQTGLWGEIKPEEIENLKARHAWYFKDKPNWSYSNTQDVLDFQTKYDEEFQKKYGYSYFKGDRKFSKKDGRLGEYTFNAPGIELSEEPKKDVPEDVLTEDPKEPIEPGKVETSDKTPGAPFDFTNPDKLSMITSASFAPKAYFPWSPNLSFRPNRLALQDWQSQAQNLQQSARAAQETLGTYQPGQALASNFSYLQGQTANNIAETIARTDAGNVDRFNNFELREGARKDLVNQFNQKNMADLYDKGVATKEAFRQESIDAADRFTKSYANAWNNRMNLGLVNKTNPIYNIDPRTGKSFFINGYSPEYFSNVANRSGGFDWQDAKTKFAEAQKFFPGLNEETFLKYSYPGSRTIDKDGDNMPDSRSRVQYNKKGGQVNPLIAYLLGGFTFDPRDY